MHSGQAQGLSGLFLLLLLQGVRKHPLTEKIQEQTPERQGIVMFYFDKNGPKICNTS